MITVYYPRENPNTYGPQPGYVAVAQVYTNDLDEAFSLTQNAFGPWIENEQVQADGPARSSMVGPLFAKDGQVFRIMPVGFAPLRVTQGQFEAMNELVIEASTPAQKS